MPWIGPTIGAASSIIGDVFSAQGQQQANQMNMALMKQSEQWQEGMSDTAMQRRVQDLKGAGLNPLLAVGEGGASTPGITAPTMQNPNQAFGNLGSQMSSAVQLSQLGSQISANEAAAKRDNASADMTDAQRLQKLPAEVQQLHALTGLTSDQSLVAQNQASLLASQVLRSDQAFTTEQIEQQMAGMNRDVLRGTVQSLISASQSDAMAKKLALPGLANLSSVEQSNLGKVLAYANAILGTASSAAGIAEKVKSVTQGPPPPKPAFNRTTNTQHFNPDGSEGGSSSTQSYDVVQ